MVSTNKNPFVDLILDQGIVTNDQLKEAIDRQFHKGGSLEENLVELGHFTEESIVSIFVNKFGFTALDLNDTYIDTDALKLVPSWLARKLSLIPVRKSEDHLAVAMADPLDKEAVDALKKEAYRDILLFVSEKSNIDAFISKCYGSSETLKPSTYIHKAEEKLPLIKRFTFDNFITGKSNDFAYSIALATARSYSEENNPLFIYSGVGLGKTHLLIGIWNYIVEHELHREVLYCTSADFASELKEAIEQRKMDTFKRKYRSIDVLLIDDIGFFANNEVAQEQFFHIFNYLFQNNKQVVVTSDRPPREHLAFMERLRSRFEGGVIASIDAPDFETRVAILKKKANEIKLADEVISLIAEKINTNVRELVGALKDILVFCKYKKRSINLEEAEELLQKRIPVAVPEGSAK
jgi:chromosomal replication initiator protein